jgi:hypothetical protein
MTKENSINDAIESINDMLNKTDWASIKPGLPRKIKVPESERVDVSTLMNHYRSAGWIVRTSIMIEPKKRTYTMEFVNPHHC